MKKMFGKIIAMMLIVVMVTGVLPVSALAEDTAVVVENEYPVLEPETEYSVEINSDTTEKWYQFTPKEDGIYSLCSEGDYDTYCELYDSDKSKLAENDDHLSLNFRMQYELTAGKTYYYMVRMLFDNTVGNFTIQLNKNVPIETINISFSNINAQVGTKEELSYSVLPENAAIENVTWSSSDDNVVRVDEYGTINCINTGVADIIAATESGVTGRCSITVNEATAIKPDETYKTSTNGMDVFGHVFKFVPEKDQKYRFYSFNASGDPEAELIDENFETLIYDDSNGENDNFIIDYKLNKGETYYYYASSFDNTQAFDFEVKLIELYETAISDAYITADGEKLSSVENCVKNDQNVRIYFKLKIGNDLYEINSVSVNIHFYNSDGTTEEMQEKLVYDSENDLYYIEFKKDMLEADREIFVNNITINHDNDCLYDLFEYNGKPLSLVYFIVGENKLNETKNYNLEFEVVDNITENEFTSGRIVTFSEFKDMLPEIKTIEGAEFLGWKVYINYLYCGLVKNDEDIIDLSQMFRSMDETNTVTFTAAYDHHIVKGIFDYKNEQGSRDSEEIYFAEDFEYGRDYDKWLDLVEASGKLDNLDKNELYQLREWTVVDSDIIESATNKYTIINAKAKYNFDAVMLGGVGLKNGMYMDNEGNLSETQPDEGYAYFNNGKLILNDFQCSGNTENNEYMNALYYEGDLEIILEGNNFLQSDDNVIFIIDGNLTIDGTGRLELITTEDADACCIQGGNLNIKSGTISSVSGDDGYEISGDIIIDGGLIKIKTGDDDGLDSSKEIIINGGTIDIESADKAIDSIDSVIINGGNLNLYSHEDHGIQSDEKVVINDGFLNIHADRDGLNSEFAIEINGGYISIISGEYAALSYENIIIGENMESPKVVISDGMYTINANEAIFKLKETEPINLLQNDWVVLSAEKGAYSGQLHTPEITITDYDSNVLEEGKDYTLTWSDNEIKDIGVYDVIIEGIGAYQGTIVRNYYVYNDYIYIGNIKVESGSYLPVDAAGIVYERPGRGGYAYYENGTLLLNNFVYIAEKVDFDSGDILTDSIINDAIIYTNQDIEIVLEGKNKLENINEYGLGIFGGRNLIISGAGSLSLKSNYGIIANDSVSINDSNIEVDCMDEAIFGYTVSIENAKVLLRAEHIGLFAEIDLIVNNSNLDIFAEEGIVNYYEKITFADSLININAVKGIHCEVEILIDGGAVIIESTEVPLETRILNLKEGTRILLPEEAKIEQAGNYTCIFDKDGNKSLNVKIFGDMAPVIIGAEDGKTYYKPVELNVVDDNLKSVTVNGEPVNDILAPIILSNDKNNTFTVSATDESGNTTEIIINLALVSEINKPIEEKENGSVTSDDKESIMSVIDKTNELLMDEELTEEERKLVEKTREDAEALLEAINAAYDAVNTDNIKQVKDITADNVSEENKLSLEAAKADYLKAIEEKGNNYTEAEKSFIENEIARIDAALEVLKVVLGDVNSDEKINAQDALLVLKHSAKISELTGDSLKAADVTFDNMINASDALDILKYAANIIDKFEN